MIRRDERPRWWYTRYASAGNRCIFEIGSAYQPICGCVFISAGALRLWVQGDTYSDAVFAAPMRKFSTWEEAVEWLSENGLDGDTESGHGSRGEHTPFMSG